MEVHLIEITREIHMPVRIRSFETFSEDDEFTALREQKSRKTDSAMVALLDEIATGRPVRVPLVEGQSARGLRTAISRAAGSRGLSVETVEGEGFVAVRKAADEPRSRMGKQSPSIEGPDGEADHRSVRRGRGRKSPRCGIQPLGRARTNRSRQAVATSRHSPTELVVRVGFTRDPRKGNI